MILDLMLMQAVSPVHVGSGQGEGAIDLPIARSVVTGFPLIPGSGVKGALRHHLSHELGDAQSMLIAEAFGPDTKQAVGNAHAGALQFGDFGILLLPVRSVSGTFAWVSCPHVLARFKKDLAHLGVDISGLLDLNPEQGALLCSGNKLDKLGGRVGLDELLLFSRIDSNLEGWADFFANLLLETDGEKSAFKNRLCVVSDEQFSYFSRFCTDVRARVSIDDNTGAAKSKGLWFEENLPVETVLWGLIGTQTPVGRSRTGTTVEEISSILNRVELLQIGGKTSVGRGLVQVSMLRKDSSAC